LGTGIVLGTVWTSAPLKRKIAELQSNPMERVLMLEQLLRQEMEKTRALETVTVPQLVEDLKWSRAKVQAQESDLKRMNQKLEKDSWSGMDLPQQNMSYWRVEGPKLKQRVLDLEMELESLRSKTVWKE
jgi:hypothetical protein